jgi:urea transport system permease protein
MSAVKMSAVRTDSRWLELIGIALVAALILVFLPLVLDIFRLNLVGKYLTYAFVAVGLVLCWGHTGILSLGQGLFFGLGGYCMAAFLKLEASSVANTKIQSTPGIPDFMDWNQITALPFFWVPFKSLPFALVAVVAVPALAAFILGAALFKRRVGGVYFAIITQALAAVMTILIVGQQGYTGGINGITDLRTLLGLDIRPDSAKYILYFVCSILLIGNMFLARFVLASKLGRILVATRDQEDRVRFSGYDVANYKTFVFCLASAMAAVGGAMFTLQVGFMSPSFVGIVPSIEMVIFCAVGGRHSVVGAVAGTLLVNWGKTLFSEEFPQLWLFAMGGLFIAVVIAFPRGLAGIATDWIIPQLRSRMSFGRGAPVAEPAPAE